MMNTNFAKNTYLASIDYVTSLFAATGRDGALRMPENFGADDERDDKFDVFQMFWSRDDLNQLITEFSALYAELSAIAEVYDKLDDNEEHVGDLLDFLLVVLSHSSHPLTQRAGLGPAGIYRGSKFSVGIYCRTLGGKCQVSCGPLFHPRQVKERAGALSLTGEGGKRVIPPPSGRNV